MNTPMGVFLDKLRPILEKACAHNIDERYATATDLCEALKQLVDDLQFDSNERQCFRNQLLRIDV